MTPQPLMTNTTRKKRNSDRVARRRFAARRRCNYRQQRWRDAAFLIRNTVIPLLREEEDAYLRHELFALLDRIEKRAARRETEDVLVLRAISRGCFTPADVQSETGFPIPMVKEICRWLIAQGKVHRKNNIYQLTEEPSAAGN